ncbi:DNRLRE domain-containing protein [Niastella caeni]|uniref:DNRLRE domain-containing protein n=1 Tax=Niastella caeni TaxID=2569763 RepID=A0A4S8HI15_9BACT|nr:DNRLRE domain-containing protein [Niastella caeni]THU34840.1 DNRLRE domain-containing protein [Niastella caeni]
MKKINLLSALAILAASSAFSQTQTEITLQPDACRGKDTHIGYINGIPSAANSNFGTLEEMAPVAWTWYSAGGSDGATRALIDFADLQLIPQGTVVTYAYLSLYGKPSSLSAPQGNQGDNNCYVQRVTSAWDENTVTWNTSPTSTAANQVSLPGSNGVTFNYDVVDLNITTLIQDIINQPPASRHGLLIRLQTESIYRSIIFASSDYSVAAKRPKLRLGLNFCSGAAARTATQESKIVTPDVLGANGKVSNGVSALVKANLSSNVVTVDYELSKEGKTYVEIVTIEGAVLKTLEVDGTKGKHTRTINLDNSLLKNKMAVLVVKQGNSKTANPFIISK